MQVIIIYWDLNIFKKGDSNKLYDGKKNSE